MTAFSAAIATIFRDRNMAADALWRPGKTSPGTTVRFIRQAPDLQSDFGSSRISRSTILIDVMLSQVPTPAEGDLFEIDGQVLVVQGAPRRDSQRLTWSLELVPFP